VKEKWLNHHLVVTPNQGFGQEFNDTIQGITTLPMLIISHKCYASAKRPRT
jgi:hypothetical protein